MCREVVASIRREATMQMLSRPFSSENGVILTCLFHQISSLVQNNNNNNKEINKQNSSLVHIHSCFYVFMVKLLRDSWVVLWLIGSFWGDFITVAKLRSRLLL